MVFDPNQVISSTLALTTSIVDYFLLPTINVGFIISIIIAVITIAYVWIVKKGTHGAVRSIGIKK
jgi:hypothetical protein